MPHDPPSRREWLLDELCVRFGYCFVDALMRADGLDPAENRKARAELRDFIAGRL